MADKFTDALADLRDALTGGAEVEAALLEVATDHDLPVPALRNRATLAWNDLAAFGPKNKAVRDKLAEQAKRNEEIAELLAIFKAYRKDPKSRPAIADYLCDKYLDDEEICQYLIKNG